MPPNTETVSKLDQFKAYYKQAANPYSDTKRRQPSEDSTEADDVRNAGSSQHEASDEATEPRNRITTRAKLTYELYRYTKNAMLILSTQRKTASYARDIEDLRSTFGSFRFEVEVHLVSDPRKLYEKCHQFFQRDFTEYGAMALAIVTLMAVNEAEDSRDCHDTFFEEAAVVVNFRLDRNPTLAGKPKIYISEANRRTMGRSRHEIIKIDPEIHGDVIGFHVAMSIPDFLCDSNALGSNERKLRPMQVLCKKMNAMAKDHTLPKIIDETIKGAVESFPLLKYIPIDTTNTLSKELYLERVDTNESPLDPSSSSGI